MTATEIKALRDRLGLTQEDFAAKINVRLITVQRWERKNKPCAPSRLALARLQEIAKL